MKQADEQVRYSYEEADSMEQAETMQLLDGLLYGSLSSFSGHHRSVTGDDR